MACCIQCICWITLPFTNGFNIFSIDQRFNCNLTDISSRPSGFLIRFVTPERRMLAFTFSQIFAHDAPVDAQSIFNFIHRERWPKSSLKLDYRELQELRRLVSITLKKTLKIHLKQVKVVNIFLEREVKAQSSSTFEYSRALRNIIYKKIDNSIWMRKCLWRFQCSSSAASKSSWNTWEARRRKTFSRCLLLRFFV